MKLLSDKLKLFLPNVNEVLIWNWHNSIQPIQDMQNLLKCVIQAKYFRVF